MRPFPRIEAARQLLQGDGGSNAGLLNALKGRGKVLVYGFDENMRRITSIDQLKADGQFTNYFPGRS